MWKYGVKFFLVVTLFGLTSQKQSRNKLRVSIYYEALCGDSVDFIKNQFTPSYNLIGSKYLDVDWIPYGKANHMWDGSKYQFRCQHGPKECFGNTLHACAVMQKNSQEDLVQFVNCTMGAKDLYSEKEMTECSEKCNFLWNEMKKCVNGQLGNILLAHFGDMTQSVKPQITFVPTVIFNDNFDQNLQYRAITDFFNTACHLLDYRPSKCPRPVQYGQYYVNQYFYR